MRIYYCSEECQWQSTQCDCNHEGKAVSPADYPKLMNLLESMYQQAIDGDIDLDQIADVYKSITGISLQQEEL